MAFFQTAGTTPFIQLWLKLFRSTALEQAPRCFSIYPVIQSGPGAFFVFTFFGASLSSFMLKGSVKGQSRFSPYDDRMMFSVVCCLLKLMPNWFCTINIHGGELRWRDFMKCSFNIVMFQDACESICFKVGMMLNTTKLYSLIPVWITLMFTQGHRVKEKLELVQSLRCEAAWSNSNVPDG